MSPSSATVIVAFAILTLFLLGRDRNSRVSSAIWIPVIWLSLGASRSVSQWLGGVGSVESVENVLEGNSFDAAVFGGLLVAGLMVLVVRRWRSGAFLRSNAPLLIFLFYCAVSALWSEIPLVAFKRSIKAVGDLVMVLVVLTDPEPTTAVKRLLARPGFVLIPLSILLIKYYPDLGRQYSAWTGEVMNVGVSTQKNGLGLDCLIFGLGPLWYLLEAFRSGERGRQAGPLIAHGSILAMALWLFLIANSATSFGCFLIGGGLLTVTRLWAPALKPAFVHLLVGTALFVLLYSLILNPEAGLVEAVGRNPTLTGRTEIWDQALAMTVDPLFGAGYESFWLSGGRLQKIMRVLRADGMPHAHNGYLEVYLNLGYIGVALLGLVMAWGYRNVISALNQDPEAGRLKLAFFVVATVYNMTEYAFRQLHPLWIVFLLAITVVPKPRPEDRGSS